MLQLRPTFSESWYRVATLRPKLRGGAQISRQYYRGDRWYVVRDPAGNQFHRLSDPAYRFVGLLDGKRTITEAWDLVGGQLADDAPTQPEVIQILSQLYAANLLETDVTPDATVLLRRHKDQVKRKMQGRLMNVLFPRVPLWDPDRFLLRWLPLAKIAFSKFGAVLWLLVVGAAICLCVPNMTQLIEAGKHALDLNNNWQNLFWLYLSFVLIKLIHELGHAFSCRRFGGECHELGLMLLVLMPTPYVDASTAWAFPSRWARAFVGAAGMTVELFVAALCAFVWYYTRNSHSLVNALAYNVMFIASVSTLIFNANPLLRYDGYYILSDLLEIPNLRQKSTEYAMGLIKRHVFRLKLPQPLPPVGQRFWLLLYAVASSIYRVFIGVMIMVVVTFKVPVLGYLMAAGGVATWVVVPVYKVTKYLAIEPELHRKRGRAALFCGAVAAACVFLIGIVRFPVHVNFEGVLKPDSDETRGQMVAGVDGFVDSVPVRDGQRVRKGDTLVVLRNPLVDANVERAQAEYERLQADTVRNRTADLVMYEKDLADEKAYKSKLDDALDKKAKLTMTAPFDGVVVAKDLRDRVGSFAKRGENLGEIAVLDTLVVRGDVQQSDFELARQLAQRGEAAADPQVRLAGFPGAVLKGRAVFVGPSGTMTIVDPSISNAGGTDLTIDPTDPKKSHVAGPPVVEVQVTVDNAAQTFVAGQRASVRFTLDKQPLLWHWSRWFLQLIQGNEMQNTKWM